jgi:hypothetical protein
MAAMGIAILSSPIIRADQTQPKKIRLYGVQTLFVWLRENGEKFFL